MEVDGSAYDEKEQKAYDEARTKDLARMDIHVLRSTNEAAKKNRTAVLSRLREFVMKTEKNNDLIPGPSPRWRGELVSEASIRFYFRLRGKFRN